MAMTIKITAFIDDNVNKVGWSESWFTNNSGPLDTLLTTWDSAFTSRRLAILEDTCSIVCYRASNVDHPRDSYYKAIGSVGTISHTAQPALDSWSALLMRKDSLAFNAFNHWFIRGIPATIFAGRVYTPLSGYGITFDANLLTLVTSIKAFGSALRKGPGPSYTYPNWDNQSLQGKTERKPGRPFGTYRGKRLVA
jgi:hypothetical protein